LFGKNLVTELQELSDVNSAITRVHINVWSRRRSVTERVFADFLTIYDELVNKFGAKAG
jgi:hypothetical protein